MLSVGICEECCEPGREPMISPEAVPSITPAEDRRLEATEDTIELGLEW
jgi:hypothetical protein